MRSDVSKQEHEIKVDPGKASFREWTSEAVVKKRNLVWNTVQAGALCHLKPAACLTVP